MITSILQFKQYSNFFLFILLVFCGSALMAQTTKKIDLGEFHTISLNSDYVVTVRQSNTQEVIATADAEILSASTIWVDNGILHIDVKSEDSGKKTMLKKIETKLTSTMELKITMQNLKKIIVNGNGSVTAENSISSSMLEVEVNGNGRVNLDVKSSRVKASLFAPGQIQITGYADNLDLLVAGNGNFNGANFDVKRINATVRGTETQCTLSVSESLTIDVFGDGEVYYKGAAKEINKHIYGNGFVLFRN